uniref:Uncharacterized protein n=1 Tax=Candidatus Kentrum sp. FW TaxID=2126338 RepID=A0A450SYP1_9GAMM|nr:MAG: hypothetical protein BECKFW1821B_GA0114236_10477 [Candidatus Kentron sp. FW]
MVELLFVPLVRSWRWSKATTGQRNQFEIPGRWEGYPLAGYRRGYQRGEDVIQDTGITPDKGYAKGVLIQIGPDKDRQTNSSIRSRKK